MIWRRRGDVDRQQPADDIERRLKSVVLDLERATLELRREVRSLRGDEDGAGDGA